jgi:hypothetical protein
VGAETLTAEQRDILLHMTGLDRSDRQTRKHYCASEGTEDYDVLTVMAVVGLVRGPVKGDPSVWGDACFFYVTLDGVLAARATKGV